MGLLNCLILVLNFALSLQTSDSVSLFAWDRRHNESRLSECHVTDSNWTYFEDIAAVIKSSTDVILCSELINLDNEVRIADVEEVSIFGYGATIKCSNSVSSGSGLRFISVTSIDMYNMTVHGCTHPFGIVRNRNNSLKTSLSFFMSQYIGLHHIRVLDGPDTGLALINVKCQVLIENCVFSNNGHSNKNGGNGVYVELSSYLSLKIKDFSKCVTTSYLVVSSTMENNVAHTKLDDEISGFSRFDKGGGLCTFIRGVSNVFFKIVNCSIINNMAYKYGGGVYVSFHGQATNSSFTISYSNISSNEAMHGGGLYSSYLHVRSPRYSEPANCSYLYYEVTFEHNDADFGGGLSVYSITTKQLEMSALLQFVHCAWISNEALFGSALAVLPNAWNEFAIGYFPGLTFENIIVRNNRLKNLTIGDNSSKGYTQHSKGAGTFFSSSHMLNFSGSVDFLFNQGSALYMELGTMHFWKNCKANFTGNKAYQGGAIFMFGSILYIHDNTSMIFDSNFAYESGGAIFSIHIRVHTYYYSKTCFIDYSQDENEHRKVIERNISVQFINNIAQSGNSEFGVGQSIYVSSLKACKARYFFHNRTTHFFDNIGTFSFYPENRDLEISTACERPEHQLEEIMLSSGREETLPYVNKDELNQTTLTFYFVSIINSNDVTIDEAYRQISRNKIIVYGRANSTATLVLSYRGSRYIESKFHIRIKMCPPVYVDNFTKCVCSVDNYVGIKRCNNELFTAVRRKGFWVGYEKNGSKQDTLLTGYCPIGFCQQENLNLSSSPNSLELSDTVCDKSRTGILCGKCKPGFVTHYHSLNLECKPTAYCYLGWLLYVVTEILPVTVIFVLVITFNLSFTSGVLNGFIFYCQVVEFIPITAYDLIQLRTTASILYKIHQGLYQTFNLSPLMISETSYCILPRGSGLDIIMFSYVTLLYALLLLLVLLVVINIFKATECKAFRKVFPMRHSARSTIHGLSAFLLLCYAQCGKTSFLLLHSVKLYKKGKEYDKTVLYFNGEMEWMSPDHFKYAIPAIILCSFIVILPLLLLMYPLHYKVLALLKVGESNLVRKLNLPLEKLKPFFDSFQGSFKDEYRFFAGLYFVYRFAILFIVSFFKIQEVYFLLELLLIVIIMVHVICQPYRNGNHNRIDTLLFINLAIVNTISFYNFANVNSDDSNENTAVLITSTVQNILILLPSLVIVILLVKKNSCVKKLVERLHHQKQVILDEDELLECASANRFDQDYAHYD